ncbi:MAG: DUF1080 domain-containing protein [Bryobacteraceae bacterium]|nr:DUF1080 domain-containing protein [Bryobacteraceae bacterium]
MRLVVASGVVLLLASAGASAQPLNQAPKGFVSLFNGKDLADWKIPEGDNGHWKVIDGAIDYDARSEAKGSKDLWTRKEFKDFVLKIDWRIKEVPYWYPNTYIIMPDGSYKTDEKGEPIKFSMPDSDSGILLRGGPQINIWNWPAGSGEIWSVRLNKDVAPEVRAAAVPKVHADRNIGEWNTFEITLKGKRVNVLLNGKLVIENALIPEIAEKGPIGLQHHGSFKDGKWTGPPSLMQFRNIFIREL